MSKAKPLPALSLVMNKLAYDPLSGVFTWKDGRRRGFQAGCVKGDYIKIQISNEQHFAHRLAFYIHYGKEPIAEIDHIDGNGSNNAIRNLREANRQQNARNRRGTRGLDFDPRCRAPYRARIKYGHGVTYLGSFHTQAEARQAYESAANKHFAEFSPVYTEGRSETQDLVGE